MYHKRLRTYKKMGYEICLNLTSEKQHANAIFDSGTYKPVFEKDLVEANREIVISSPGLNVPKVKAFIKQVKAVQENGVQIVVFTLSPECYPASRTEITRKLVRKLEQAGIRVLLQEALHEHYAVIDHEIVWYGSMNFLSAEKEEDNLMRVVSGEIAEELLGGSVGFSIRE